MKRSNVTAALLVSMLAIIPSGAYGLGYFASDKFDDQQCGIIHRRFATRWQCKLYCPLAQLERSVEGKPLLLRYEDGAGFKVYKAFP